jgi:hypothetical protein
MRAREHKGMIELVAEDRRETEILRKLFNGIGSKRFRKSSFGYDRKMPRRASGKTLENWAKCLVLTFKLRDIS